MREFAVVLVLAVSACATAHPARASQSFRFTTGRDVVKGCTPLGSVDARYQSDGGTRDQASSNEDPLTRLRREAVKLGADTVLLPEAPGGLVDMSRISGEAYQCAHPE